VKRHVWTAHDYELLRTYYDGKSASIKKLEGLTGASHNAIKQKAIGLRLTKRQKPPDWSQEEYDKLAKLAPDYSPNQIAKKLKRSENAVSIKLYRMNICPNGRSWYTVQDLIDIFGVNFKTVQKWVESGKLQAERYKSENGFWKVTPEDLRQFVIRCPLELQGRKVDMVFLVDLLANYQANGKEKHGVQKNKTQNRY